MLFFVSLVKSNFLTLICYLRYAMCCPLVYYFTPQLFVRFHTTPITDHVNCTLVLMLTVPWFGRNVAEHVFRTYRHLFTASSLRRLAVLNDAITHQYFFFLFCNLLILPFKYDSNIVDSRVIDYLSTYLCVSVLNSALPSPNLHDSPVWNKVDVFPKDWPASNPVISLKDPRA